MVRFNDVGGFSVQGGRSEQQDVFFFSPSRGAIGVFDGHGDEGSEASRDAARALYSSYRDEYIEFPDNLTTDFLAIDRALTSQQLDGGTTATIVRVDRLDATHRTIFCNNVGDSPAVLINPRNGETLSLATMHDVSNLSEIARMQDLGIETEGHYFNTPRGQIMISRALGDGHHLKGVIPKPSISKTTLTGGEGLLLVASDGVLRAHADTFDDAIEMTLDLYSQGETMATIAMRLVNEMAPRTRDNATAVVARV